MLIRITPAMDENRLILAVDGWLDSAGAEELARVCRETPRPFLLGLEGLRDAAPGALDTLTGLLESDLEVSGLHPYVALLLEGHRKTVQGSKRIRVLVVDDDEIGRQLITAALEALADVDVIGQAADGSAAVSQASELWPDVILMDLSMPVMNGAEATHRILQRHPETKIVLLTSFDVGDEVIDAVGAGAMGYLAKGCQLKAIADAVRTVHGGGTYLPAAISKTLSTRWQQQPSCATLTRRESEIIGLVAKGLRNQQIADQLFLSSATVRTHLGQIYEKLALTNRVELALFALREGLARLDEESESGTAELTPTVVP